MIVKFAVGCTTLNESSVPLATKRHVPLNFSKHSIKQTMKSGGSGSSLKSDVTVKHRKLIFGAIESSNAEALLRAYHARDISVSFCMTPQGDSRPSMSWAASLDLVDVLILLHELGVDLNTCDSMARAPIN